MRARTVLVMLLAAPALAVAQGGGGSSGAPQMVADPTPFEQYVNKLTLRTEQLAQIQKVFTAAATEAAPISRELVGAREAMLTAEVAGNAEQFGAAAASYATAAAKMATIEIKAVQQAATVLTPKQISKSAEAFVVMAGLFNQPSPRLNLAAGAGRRGGAE
jgi:Spy/CpxP family protein refolding chaperone